jgi:hypothetical protein
VAFFDTGVKDMVAGDGCVHVGCRVGEKNNSQAWISCFTFNSRDDGSVIPYDDDSIIPYDDDSIIPYDDDSTIPYDDDSIIPYENDRAGLAFYLWPFALYTTI